MRARIFPGRAVGAVRVPASKSMAHRLLICAGMSEGESIIHGISPCEDVLATVDCLRAAGASCELHGDTATVRGISFLQARAEAPLACRESGSTLRFFIPPMLLSGNPAVFTASGRLPERPMEVYRDLCRERGLLFLQAGDRITVQGPLTPGEYRLPGNVSSQFITGLLLALPLLQGESRITLTTPLESRSYLLLTADAMRQFGVKVIFEGEQSILVPGGQHYRPQSLAVEGDYSNAAFPDAFNHLGGAVHPDGLREDSLQGDRRYREAMEALSKGRATVSLADCPDLGPILFALAAAKHGGIFTQTRRLRIKESDRVEAMREELARLGITLLAEEDRVEILPGRLHPPSEPLSGHNDHRIVMALSVLLTLVGGEIDGAEAIRKSYPAFFSDLSSLGIRVILFENASTEDLPI